MGIFTMRVKNFLFLHSDLQCQVRPSQFCSECNQHPIFDIPYSFRLDALALSVIATATWLAGWLAGCLSQPVLYQND